MSGDIFVLLKEQRRQIVEEKRRLGLNEVSSGDKGINTQNENCDNEHQKNILPQPSEDKENILNSVNSNDNSVLIAGSPLQESKKLPLIERLDLTSHNDGANLEESKLVYSKSSPISFRSDVGEGSKMLRYGEYSPNNPQLRVTAAPYIGLGEYEQRRNLLLQQQRADYLQHLSQVRYDLQRPHEDLNSYLPNSVMQNSRNFSYRVDQRLTSAQNALLKPEMDKPKGILSNRQSGSSRERVMSNVKYLHSPSFLDGFSYQDRTEELERERIKREGYQQELKLQIEEKHRLQAMREEQERREQELENRRLEQQLLRMQEEQIIEEQRRCRRDDRVRRHSDDLLRRKHELQFRPGFRKHTDSESSLSSLRNTNVASKAVSHYSPPVSRRNPYSFNIPSTSVFADSTRYNLHRFDSYNRKDTLNRMDSLNTYDTHNRFNSFSRYDSLSRIDSLRHQDTLNRIEALNIQDNLSNAQRRHSATQQDLSLLRRSPKLQRRSSSSRFDDALPIPVLKAHSPVARELKNSVPFVSRHSSDAIRKLEDKWQIPAVQKNFINHGDTLREGQSRSILTQLGAIRMQLQQEQVRMDETLRKRNFTQSKAVDFN